MSINEGEIDLLCHINKIALQSQVVRLASMEPGTINPKSDGFQVQKE